jgi:hypothetical protein
MIDPEAKCEATGCQNGAVDCYITVHPVPTWRRPADIPDTDTCYECGPKIHFCEDHRATAEDPIASKITRHQ